MRNGPSECRDSGMKRCAGRDHRYPPSSAHLICYAVAYWEGMHKIPKCEPVACRLMREALHKVGVEFFRVPTPGVRIMSRLQNQHQYARSRPRASWSSTVVTVASDGKSPA